MALSCHTGASLSLKCKFVTAIHVITISSKSSNIVIYMYGYLYHRCLWISESLKRTKMESKGLTSTTFACTPLTQA